MQETETKAIKGMVGVAPIIELRGVSKYYGQVVALKDFALMPSEIYRRSLGHR